MSGHFKRKGKRFLGIDRQVAIRRFFGGNAMLSIVILFLICLFLLREAVLFFPGHHDELQLYRESGQEYVGYVIKETDEYTRLVSWTNQAYYQELDASYGEERGTMAGFEVLAEILEDEGEDLIDDWADAEEGEEAAEAKAAWMAFLDEQLAEVDRSEVDPAGRLGDERWAALLVAMREWDPVEEEPPGLVDDAEGAIREGMEEFGKARAELVAAGQDLKRLRDRLTKVASEIKAEAVAGQTAAARKAALLEGSRNAATKETRERLAAEAAEITVVESFPYAERRVEIVESKDEHREAVETLKSKSQSAVAALPKEVSSPESTALLGQVHARYPKFLKHLNASLAEASEWDPERRVGWLYSAKLFFFGTDWVTNSSWHDSYGLLPLFTGSILISIIALLVAVPFSIGAAIYVNRLAGPKEQMMVKPAIEMIQAIPSVVLGFFGIVVLGEGLRELSQVEWLSWVPGFPMQERLNILNAGLLLALMAVPTIFTLCEDALNNVPSAFSEASLALGASKLQTILKVVVPTAMSGILAAVLLGFGRVIGETMVVLLVAGNQIAVPDFSAGLGVVTQPAHTMTGIIAQEMGEVSQGTLHWRALFLVGLVLFVISLVINYTAQRVIRRLGHA
jgi:phosphate transport system permease protein